MLHLNYSYIDILFVIRDMKLPSSISFNLAIFQFQALSFAFLNKSKLIDLIK